tara:strand:- start:814 stop:1290 length:477 start_codon:yes stop_codon:yes gene_type:complete
MTHSQTNTTPPFPNTKNPTDLAKFSALLELFETSIQLQISAFKLSEDDAIYKVVTAGRDAATHNALAFSQLLLSDTPFGPNNAGFQKMTVQIAVLLQQKAQSWGDMMLVFDAAGQAVLSVTKPSEDRDMLLHGLGLVDDLIELQVAILGLNNQAATLH